MQWKKEKVSCELPRPEVESNGYESVGARTYPLEKIYSKVGKWLDWTSTISMQVKVQKMSQFCLQKVCGESTRVNDEMCCSGQNVLEAYDARNPTGLSF